MVTVLMPAYNASGFIKPAIDSILKQTHGDFELLIINDGSTDNTESLIKAYNDPRIRYYYQSNQGVAATLNNGIALTKGKYIWRHDADDISLPTKLEEEVQFLEKNPGIALCACQIAFMTERGKVAWHFRQPKNDYWTNAQPYKLVERKDFNPYSPITHGTVLVRTDVMKAIGGYRSAFITGEDIDVWLQLIQQYNAVVLNKCLSLHRLNKSSATQKHGWKNEFFRNLAFKFYEQREKYGRDDLQNGLSVILPPVPFNNENPSPGKFFREDLLGYFYELHLDAADWVRVWEIWKSSLLDGWKITNTWKQLLFPLLGKRLLQTGVTIKQLFKR